jgi:hypothetical protein
METPASISNSARAATLIQRAFRGAQRRIAAEQEDLSAILCAMEEADEARINRRESVMSKVNRTLEDFISTVGSKLRGGGEGAATTRALTPKSLTKPALPTLTSGSVQNLIAGLGEDERVAMVDALAILQAATVLFMNEPSVVDVHVPENGRCIVVGDLHGQLVRERDDDAPTPRVVVVTRRGSPRDPSERSEDPRRELLLRVVRSAPPSNPRRELLLRVILASRPFFLLTHTGRFPFLVRTTSFTSSASSARRARRTCTCSTATSWTAATTGASSSCSSSR